MKLPVKLTTIVDHVINYLAYLAGAFVVFIMLSISGEIMGRSLLGRSIVWAVPFSEYSLLYITMLGTAWLLRREGHPSLDIVVNRLDPRAGALVNVTMSIVGAIICLVVTCSSAVTTLHLFQTGASDPAILEVPKGPLVLVIPIGSFLLSIQFVRRASGHLRSWKASPNKERAT